MKIRWYFGKCALLICCFNLTLFFCSDVKPVYRRAEKELFTRRNAQNPIGVLDDIGPSDFPELLSACSKELDFETLNIRAWRRDGMIPFTEEEVYWNALERELRIERLQGRIEPSGNQPMSSRQALEQSAAREKVALGVDIGIGIDVDVPNPTVQRRAALAKSIRECQQDDEFLRRARAALEDSEHASNPLRPFLSEILTSHTKMVTVVTDFVKDNAAKIRSADVAFLPGGVTSDAALARAELGVNNTKRAAEDTLRKRQEKKRKEEDTFVQAIQDAPAILARIKSLDDLTMCTRAQLITLHHSVLRNHPKGQPKKADLIAALTQEISKEIENRNQTNEPHDELPGVPVPAPVNVIDAEMPEIAHIEPMTETQTSLEPTPTGGKDVV